MTAAIHFIRVDLGEVSTSESFNREVETTMRGHDNLCDYPVCVDKRKQD